MELIVVWVIYGSIKLCEKIGNFLFECINNKSNDNNRYYVKESLRNV